MSVDFATLVGGNAWDEIVDLDVDSSGRVVFAGNTKSPNLPITHGAFQVFCGGDGVCGNANFDTFVGRLNSDGSKFEFLTYIGGQGADKATFVALDSAGNILVGGSTTSISLPFTGAPLGHGNSGVSGYVAKFAAEGTNAVWLLDLGSFVPLGGGFNASGGIWLAGRGSDNLPITNGAPISRTSSPYPLYVVRLSAEGTEIEFATYWGGYGPDSIESLHPTADGGAIVCGRTRSIDFPSTNRSDTRPLPRGAPFVTRFNANGQVRYSRAIVSGPSTIGGCDVDNAESVHLVGQSYYARLSPVDGGVETTHMLKRLTFDVAVFGDGIVRLISSALGRYDGVEIGELTPDGKYENLGFYSSGVNDSTSHRIHVDAHGQNFFSVTTFREEAPRSNGAFYPTAGAAQTVLAGDVDASLVKLNSKRVELRAWPFSVVVERGPEFVITFALSPTDQVRAPLKLSTDAPWIELPPYSADDDPIIRPENRAPPFPVTVKVGSPGQIPGIYKAEIVASIPSLLGEPVRIPVEYRYGDPFLPSPKRLDFDYIVGQEREGPIGNVYGDLLEFEVMVDWISLRRGIYSDSVEVWPDLSKLGLGVHRTTILHHRSADGQVVRIPVEVTISNPDSLASSPASLHMMADASNPRAVGGALLIGARQYLPVQRRVETIESDESWLIVDTYGETYPTRVAFRSDPAGLDPGVHHGRIKVDLQWPAAPIEVPVTLHVTEKPPITANPASLAYILPADELLAAKPTTRIESADSAPFSVENNSGEALLHLSPNPMEGTNPGDISFTFQPNTSGLINEYRLNVRVGGSRITIPVVLGRRVLHTGVNAIVNAASFVDGPIAPGSLASIFGTDLSFTEWQADQLPINSPAFTSSVSMGPANGRNSAQILFINPRQINVQVPDLYPGVAEFYVRPPNGGSSPSLRFQVAEAAPGIFTYSENRGVVQHLDGSINSNDNPASPGDIAVVYLTGQGSTTPSVPVGQPAPADPLSHAVLPVDVRVGGSKAEVFFAGLTPGFAGLCQVNFRIPQLSAGEKELTVQFGVAKSPPVVISVGP